MIKDDFCILVHYRNPYIVDAGTEKYIKTQIQTLRERNIDSFVLFPVTKTIGVKIFGWGVVLNGKFAGVWSEKKVINYINSLMEEHSCQGVFIHHLKWSNLDSLTRILSFTNNINFYVHDYYSCCIQENFLKNGECLCDMKINTKTCEGCVYYSEAFSRLKKVKDFFSQFDKLNVIAPSEVAKDVWLKTYPEYLQDVVVIEHQLVERINFNDAANIAVKDRKINIAFVGHGAHNKGWDDWKKAIASLDEKQLENYNFFHLGTVKEHLNNVEHIQVSMGKNGGTTMVDMLKEHGIDIAVLYSVWPETYSYTFFEALEAGCFVITSKDSGNIAAQTKKYQNGIVADENYGLKDILEHYSEVRKELVLFKEQNGFAYKIQHNKKYIDFLSICSGKITVKARYIFGSCISNVLYRLRYRKVLV